MNDTVTSVEKHGAEHLADQADDGQTRDAHITVLRGDQVGAEVLGIEPVTHGDQVLLQLHS